MFWTRFVFSAASFLLALSCWWPAHVLSQSASERIPITHPSLENAGATVVSHLREERARFESVLEAAAPASAAEQAQAYSRLARVYHAYQFEEAALACYLNLNRIQPGIYPCLYAIGWIYHRQGRFDSALRFLDEAKQRAEALPDTPSAVRVAMNCLIGEARLKSDRIEEARAAFQAAVDLDPRCAFAWHGLGLIHSLKNDSRAAIESLERALALQPHASAGRVLLAREYQRAGLKEKAAALLPALNQHRTLPFAFYDPIMARDVAPLNRSASALHTRALAARQQGNVRRAAELFQEALDLNPYFTLAKANLASACLTLNRLQEAEALARQILAEQPENASFLDLLGGIFFKSGRFEEALASFQSARQLEPDQGIHPFWIGSVLSWQGKREEALAMFHRAALLNEADANSRVGASVMMALLGRHEEALEGLRRCVELFPDSIEAKLNLAQYLSAHPDSTRQEGEEARALARPIYEQTQSVPAALALAMSHAASGDFPKAIQTQQWAMQEAGAQGHAVDRPWMNRNLQRYQDQKPSREPWNPERGFPAIEGFAPLEAAP